MKRTAAILLLGLGFVSCSTTRVLREGEYRLRDNKVQVVGTESVSSSELHPYIKQQPNSKVIFGWNPFVSIYNFRDGSGKGLDRIWEKIGQAPVVFDNSMVQSSMDNICSHLEHLGYYGSSVQTRIDTVRRTVKVNYMVSPGRRILIDSIQVVLPEGNSLLREEFASDASNMIIAKGTPIAENILENEAARSAAFFNNMGYYDLSRNNYFFQADTLSGINILRYEIRGHTRNESSSADAPIEKYRFGNVTISHSENVPVRESVLKKLNIIRSGALYNAQTVNDTYSRLASLKVFSGVGIELTPTEDHRVDCEIKLTESKLQGFKANLEASTNSSGLIGISPQLSWYHKNIFHGGEWLSLGFNGNFQFKPRSSVHSTEYGINASLSIPGFLGLPLDTFLGPNIPRTEFKVSFNWQDRPEYVRNLTNVTYGYIAQISPRMFLQVYPLQAKFVRMYNINPDFLGTLARNPYLSATFQDHLNAGAAGTILYTDNRDIVPKTDYSLVRLDFGLSGNVLCLLNRFLDRDELGNRLIFGTPYSQFVKAELTMVKALRFGRDNGQSLCFRLNAGIGHSYGNSASLPYEEQFYAGGAGSMRGWQARSLGPGTEVMDKFISIPSQTGDMKLETDMEYRFRMFWKLEGALFAEAGNIWIIRENLKDFGKSVAMDWGLGLRLNLDFILVRLDAGFRIYDPACTSLPEGPWKGPSRWFGSDGCAIHFGVGYPF